MKDFLGYNFQLIKENKWDSRLLIVKGNKMYTIGHYFTVSEVDDFVGLGFESYLLGGLSEASDEKPAESILFAIKNLNRMKSRNFFPVMLFDNQTKKKKVYYK
jgi:hypothetical protein